MVPEGGAMVPEPAVRLTREAWTARRERHEARIDGLLGGYLDGRRRGEKHPVLDFLFEYYRFRPSALRQWSPGAGVWLADARPGEPFGHVAFTRSGMGVWIDPAGFPDKRAGVLAFIGELMRATTGRPPRFGCHGLHEWAMVYRAGERRHSAWPLRMPQEELDRFVASRPIACSHFDAFRFFTEEARPMNRIQPSRKTMAENEQAGCLHTNMDLYKWAFKLFPYTGSDLIADALELALFARDVDMRASPYDLTGLGYTPIPIETDEGRRAYTRLQMEIHERSVPVRRALSEAVDTLTRARDAVTQPG